MSFAAGLDSGRVWTLVAQAGSDAAKMVMVAIGTLVERGVEGQPGMEWLGCGPWTLLQSRSLFKSLGRAAFKARTSHPSVSGLGLVT